MIMYRFLILSILFTFSNAIIEQKYNETEVLQQLFDFPFPTFKIPDLLNPDNKSSSIRNRIPQDKLINIGLPTLPNLLPTAFPFKIPTVKIPDIIPKILPTFPPLKIPTVKLPTLPHLLPTALPTFKIPTIKVPTLPHILPTAFPKLPTIKFPTLPHLLPTAFPTLFPPKPKGPTQGITPNTPFTLPYPLPSNNTNVTSNIVCDICEYAVDQLKIKFMLVETTAKKTLTDGLGFVCDKLSKIFPQLIFIESTCTLIKMNVVNKIFEKLDSVKNINEKTVCGHFPFCKYK